MTASCVIKKYIFFTLAMLMVTIKAFAAEAKPDLQKLTAECIRAAKAYKAVEADVAYKMLHEVSYQGWSGKPGLFDLQFPISMSVRYAGKSKLGHYWFHDQPNKKYPIKVLSDFDGNIEIVSTESTANKFKGSIEEGVIKGVWMQDGKDAHAFYVKPIMAPG